MPDRVTITIDPFKSITAFLTFIIWITGWVLASGFWSTFFAIIFPPWGWYLIIEAALTHFGVI